VITSNKLHDNLRRRFLTLYRSSLQSKQRALTSARWSYFCSDPVIEISLVGKCSVRLSDRKVFEHIMFGRKRGIQEHSDDWIYCFLTVFVLNIHQFIHVCHKCLANRKQNVLSTRTLDL
jgi:hypothetical protein